MECGVGGPSGCASAASSPRAPPSRQLCGGWTRGAAGGRDQRATGRGRCCGPEASPEPERRGRHGGVGKGHGGRPAPGPPALRTCRCPETSRDHLASLGSTGTQAADFLQRKPPGLRKDTILQTEKQPNAEVCRPAQGQRHLCAQRNRSWQRPLLGAGWRCPEPAGPPLGGPWSPGGPSPCHMSATAPMLPPRPKSPDGSLLLSKFLSPYYPENQPLSWQTGSSGSSLCPDSNPQGQASPAKSPYTGRPGSCTSVGTAPEQTHF